MLIGRLGSQAKLRSDSYGNQSRRLRRLGDARVQARAGERGVFKERKKRAFYEKPSVRRKHKRVEAQGRRRKEERRPASPDDLIFRPIP